MVEAVTLPSVVDSAMLDDLMKRNSAIKILDVRSPAEYESVHIPGSYNVPLDLLPEHRAELVDTLRSPAILVCQSGSRAQQAERVLREANLSQLHILEGGISTWQQKGFQVVRGRARWSMERQVRGVAGSLVLLGALLGLRWKLLSLLAAGVGAGLSYSALSNSCAMARVLSLLPYNAGASCDMSAVLQQISAETVKQA